ncbi:MAG: ComEC/Rec2 family competence protein [Alphaproteobacteria bacterium]|nr:ComEC/Rec2 family competence protein [Alphaproteobacteria bacterium]
MATEAAAGRLTGFGGVPERLTETLAAERERLALWLPVAFGGGVGFYFSLAQEPAAWLAPVVTLLSLALAVGSREYLAPTVLAVALAAAALGFATVQWRSQLVAAPVIERRIGPVAIEARVVAVEIRVEGRRLLLDRLRIEGLETAKTPDRVRLTTRRAAEGLKAGDGVALRGILLPPPAPAAPGAYDFQRQAWFDRLGGVGFVLGEIERRQTETDPTWRERLSAARQAMVERTLAALPGAAGAIAAALLTGEQGAIPPAALEAMRDSGLAHLLSISGLHIGLVAGIVFFAVRGALALIPFVALRWPIKKWAAVAAFAAITFYMLFASPGVPTQRAWLMTSVVLFAILIDRTAITMRLVAWAAAVVLALKPESLLGPSFQMSFAAVVALIAVWEATRERFILARSGAGVMRRAWLGLVGVGLTTLVAGFASAPYALYHFNRFAAFGVVANLIAVPVTSLWVMPWAVLAFPLYLVGLEDYALVPMGWGVEAILAVARLVAGWGGAVALFPAMPVWGLAALSLGGLWLCLWRTRWRLAGLPLILLGLISIATERTPDVLVSGDARLVAVRGADGLLQLSAGRAGRMTRDTWLRRAGQENAAVWPSSGTSEDGRLSCDGAGCLYKTAGHTVAIVRESSALAEDCRVASVVVALIPVRRNCPSAQVVIDRFALWREGGHAVWLEDNGRVRVETVRASRGQRPWVAPVPAPRRPAERP